jgi:hypothetical protein
MALALASMVASPASRLPAVATEGGMRQYGGTAPGPCVAFSSPHIRMLPRYSALWSPGEDVEAVVQGLAVFAPEPLIVVSCS